MTQTVVEDKDLKQNVNSGDRKGGVGLVGVPLSYGASMAGVDMGPAALRVAKLVERVSALGYEVRDLGERVDAGIGPARTVYDNLTTVD